ncbi:MAG: SIR2 family NAD-dependent protein deacylase [bacterium]
MDQRDRRESADNITKVIDWLITSEQTAVFTGAGISVDSGIPTFRGENGLWEKYDPALLTLDYFYRNPEESWQLLLEIYRVINKAQPNQAHMVLAEMEEEGFIDQIITQNIDNLHQKAGSKNVYEFHGNYLKLVCLDCDQKMQVEDLEDNLDEIPPLCDRCDGVLKPDIVFFGEGIPTDVYEKAYVVAEKAELFIIIGTSGEVAPANLIPRRAKNTGAKIVEITPEPTQYSEEISDIVIYGNARGALIELWDFL